MGGRERWGQRDKMVKGQKQEKEKQKKDEKNLSLLIKKNIK